MAELREENQEAWYTAVKDIDTTVAQYHRSQLTETIKPALSKARKHALPDDGQRTPVQN
jgi:hypothetical protein